MTGHRPAMLLPFRYLPAVYHAGDLSFWDGQIEPRVAPKNWDFECGLLSVSLHPQIWIAGWAGQGATIYDIRRPEGDIRLIDVDMVMGSHRDAVQEAALRENLLTLANATLEATEELYERLNLAFPSLSPSSQRSREDLLLETALAALALRDKSLDGLWWSDEQGGAMRSARGGLFQDRLARFATTVVSPPLAILAPSPLKEESSIIEP